MSRNITLIRRDADLTTVVSSSAITYETELEITGAVDLPKELFIKQRKQAVNINSVQFVEEYTDEFRAICTAAQLEELPAYAPENKLGDFRDCKVAFRYTNPTFMQSILDSIIAEIQILIENLDALDTLRQTQVYNITSTSIEIS
jgi:hypothetical protein